MKNKIEFIRKNDYLLAIISDTVITVERAKEIVAQVSEECEKLNCNKVVIDERTVEKRDIAPYNAMEVSQIINNSKLNQVHIAFLCKEHLIDENAKRLSLFTYNYEYTIKHFLEITDAVKWLRE